MIMKASGKQIRLTVNWQRLIFSFRKLPALFLLWGLCEHVYSQNDSSEFLRHQFDVYRKQVLQEKLFVHTDKSVYLTGEILWFKIYEVDAFFHMPFAISAVAYVELLDKNDKPLLQAKLALNKGDGNGSFDLPVMLNSGNYKLRAYTNWMKNFSPDYFFEKTVMIINTQKITDSDQPPQTLQRHIDFFPEGGNLVNSLRSKVAFRVTDQYGKGMDCEGILMDNNGDSITSFRSLKFGIGNFSFTPVDRHTYKAVIRFAGGIQIEKELPQAYDKGFVMRLERKDSGHLEITVRQAKDSPANSSQLIYLFAHTRESIKWAGTKTVRNGKAVFLVDISKLGDGISQLTIFDDNRKPVCERLYFICPKKGLQLVVKKSDSIYDCRKKIKLNIFSEDRSGNPRQADLSLAVYRLDSLQSPDGVNIDNYLWLTSDLTGRIESPDYYFNNTEPETIEASDNLMLTHGWRRFRWEDVLQNRKPGFEFTPEYNGHSITGKITDSRSGLPGQHIDGFLSVPGNNTQFRNAKSDGRGRIKFEMKNFFGSSEIVVQTNPLHDSGYTIDIASPFADKYSSIPLPYFSMPENAPQSLLYASVNTQVQHLYADKKLQEFLMPAADTSAFYADPDDRYVLDNYTRFTTLEEIIREYVQGVNISKTAGKFSLVVSDKISQARLNGTPLVLIDGVPVFDIDKFINDYDPLKIYKLEVVKRKYFFGYKSFDGILAFTTYKGDLAGYELDRNAIVLNYEGLQLQRRFYSPEYENEEQLNNHLPDFRNLLYWNPEIKTNSQGNQEEEFYTSDLPGKYAMMVQGIDASGLTGCQLVLFEVRGKGKSK